MDDRISGADALRALANAETVQFRKIYPTNEHDWEYFLEHFGFDICDFFQSEDFEFRLAQ